MKTLSAIDYGYRKVIRVVLNPNDPESVHADGTAHQGAAPAATVTAFKAQNGRTPRAWEWCHECRYNWQEIEFIWDGDEMYHHAPDGTRTLKTDDQLVAEIQLRLQPAPSAQAIVGLEGRTV